MINICVFGSSSRNLAPGFYDLARALGRAIGRAGAKMVFGAGGSGLMGAAAEGVAEVGGEMVGVIPEKLNKPGIPYPGCTELIVTPTMHVRKSTMEGLSGAFIALPGGFGTLEELLEVLTLKQLGYHSNPVIILDYEGFYDPVLKQFQVFYETGFADSAFSGLYSVTDSPQEAVAMALTQAPAVLPDKLAQAVAGRNKGA